MGYAGIDKTSISKIQVLLDHVLDHADNDERPYLKVEITGRTILGLLDSGASRTILGGKGYELIRGFGLPINTDKISFCTVANGNRCKSIGVM